MYPNRSGLLFPGMAGPIVRSCGTAVGCDPTSEGDVTAIVQKIGDGDEGRVVGAKIDICFKTTGRSRPVRSGFAVSLATSATDWSCRFHVQHARILIICRSSHETCVRKCMQCLEAPMAWVMHENGLTPP
jgi:hypothetical protein